MSFKIDTLQIDNFRGIRHINLPIAGRNLVIVGENGAGKSSIVDALEYYFTGRVEQLEGRSDVDKRQCIPNLKGGSPKVTVEFEKVASETGFSIDYPDYPRRRATIPNSLQSLFDMTAKHPFVLRRYQVLQFINARDSKRYQQVSQLIGLGALDTIDDNWRREKIAAQKRVDDLERDCQKVQDRLEELLGQPVETQVELVQAINTHLITHKLDPIADQDDLQRRLQTLRQRTKFQTGMTKPEQLHLLHERVTHIAQGIDALLAESAQLHQSMQAFWRQSAVLEDASLEHLLTEGRRVLQANVEIKHCPLCEVPILDYAALLQRLSERVANLQVLTQSRRKIGEEKSALRNQLTFLSTRLFAVSESLSTHGLAAYLPLIQAALGEIRAWQDAFDQPDGDASAVQSWQQTPIITELRQTLPELAYEVSEQRHSLMPTEAEATLFDLLMTMARADEQWQQLQEMESALQRADYVSQQVSLVHDELVAARKRGLERLRKELEGDFERLYQQLHPDEGYEAITIPVQSERRSSVALRARYQEQEEAHPLNYFSEGHLDSLGLCVFLAFIKRFGGNFKLIVLDDVLTTVDAGHRLRVARLLAGEFADYQLIVTTHDRLWAEELKTILPQARLYHLKPWSLEMGAVCRQTPPSDWDYYKQQAEDGRPYDAIAGVGRNLEKFLCQMRNNLGLAVPAKPGDDYTIGDLYGPFFRWVRRRDIERSDWPQFNQDVKAMDEELSEVWRLRNWSGAHFNVWAAHVGRDEALSFLSAVKNLVDAFACPVCQGLVVWNDNAKVLLCPYCQPAPPPRVIYQYQSDWPTEAARLLRIQNPKVRKHIPSMVQSAFARFVHDMRYRLLLYLAPAKQDEYDLPQLYEPFFAWIADHPLPDVPRWRQTLAQHKQVLDAHWRNGQWVEVLDAEVETFVDTVQQLTSLFECATCSQLLDYDHEQAAYLCTRCGEQETTPTRASAYWFVTER